MPGDAPATILFAAGSLKQAFRDTGRAFAAMTGVSVATEFAASGLLRRRIEDGEPAHVFASANMAHPEALARAGRSGQVRLFARNRLCAIVQPDLAVETETVLDAMLDPQVRLGTSTPGADPSGDYAFELFDKAEAIRPGTAAALKSKALQLTGGPESARPPAGRNQYGWIMRERRADLFLTYWTNACLARKEMPALRIVAVPEALAVGAAYGLTVLNGAPASATALADYIVSATGQSILESHGFTRGDPDRRRPRTERP